MISKAKQSAEHKVLIGKIVEMFATGDLSDVNSVIATRYIDHQGLRRFHIRGPEGFSRVVRAARSAFEGIRIDIEDLIAEGDRVAVRLRWHGNQSDGKKIDRETIDIVRFAKGRAVEHWGIQLFR